METEKGKVRPRFIVESICHPTDFSPPSEVAFVHGLKMALEARAELHILHVAGRQADIDWEAFPQVRATLEGWGVLPAGSPREAVVELGVKVRKTAMVGSDPVVRIVEYLDHSPADLIVLATHGRRGAERWARKAVAAPVAREVGTMTLFVPEGSRGFVGGDDGRVSLRRILIPVDHYPPAQVAIDAAASVCKMLGTSPDPCMLIHIGLPQGAPRVSIPDGGWTCVTFYRQGDPVERILEVANENPCDLIVMATEGRQGFLDALRGSTTERVIRGAPCPVLAVNCGLGCIAAY